MTSDIKPFSGRYFDTPITDAAIPLNKGQQQSDSAPAHGWMGKGEANKTDRLVSATDIILLSALVAYVANKSGTSEFRIERNLADRFKVANVRCLPAVHYDDAIHFLVDCVPGDYPSGY